MMADLLAVGDGRREGGEGSRRTRAIERCQRLLLHMSKVPVCHWTVGQQPTCMEECQVLVMKDTCAHTEAPVTPRSSVIVLLSPSRSRLSPAWLSPVDLGSLADLLTRSLGSRLPYLLAPASRLPALETRLPNTKLAAITTTTTTAFPYRPRPQ